MKHKLMIALAVLGFALVTGAHLHWTLRVNGARVDPVSLLAVLGSS